MLVRKSARTGDRFEGLAEVAEQGVGCGEGAGRFWDYARHPRRYGRPGVLTLGAKVQSFVVDTGADLA